MAPLVLSAFFLSGMQQNLRENEGPEKRGGNHLRWALWFLAWTECISALGGKVAANGPMPSSGSGMAPMNSARRLA
jgi:hypothetical protein